MKLKENAKFRKAKNVQWKSVEGEAVLLNLRTGNYFALDSVGTFLWSKISKSSPSYRDLINLLVLEYDCGETQARKDTLEFCGQLLAEKLLEIKE